MKATEIKKKIQKLICFWCRFCINLLVIVVVLLCITVAGWISFPFFFFAENMEKGK
jgi:hypothetical protein